MKFQNRYWWIIIAIFTVISAIFVVFIVNNDPSKNKITSSQLKEIQKELDITILRYDLDLFSLNVNNLAEEVKKLSGKYPPSIIEPDIWNNPEQMAALKAYLQDTIILALHKDAEKAINFDIIFKELKTAFGYYKIYYPDDSIPVIVTMLPGLDFSLPPVYLYDDFLFVNLDMYLGAENTYYQSTEIPSYIAERCDPLYIPVDIFKKAIVYKHLARAPRNTLLEAMITEGKKLYFTEMIYPRLHERFIIGYSE
jgi:hypothetical protein